MSSTNKTANYELSQYIGSDKPTYLVDYNGDMLKIDTGMTANKAQADATDLVVSGHTSSIEGLQGTVSDQGTAITGLRTDVDGNTGSINTINSLIGNGEPTTTDKTLIGAINELDSAKAPKATFNGTAVLKEVKDIASITADGVKSVSTLLGDLAAAVNAYLVANPTEAVIPTTLFITGYGVMDADTHSLIKSGDSIGSTFKEVFIGTTSFGAKSASVNSVASHADTCDIDDTGFTYTSHDADIPTAGDVLVIGAMVFKTL